MTSKSLRKNLRHFVTSTAVPLGAILSLAVSLVSSASAMGSTSIPPALPEVVDATISGRVWDDANGNGLQDPGEAGRANVRLDLFAEDGDAIFEPDVNIATPDPYLGSATTDANGSYAFSNVAAGSYWLAVDDYSLPDHPRLTTANEPRLVTVASGQTLTANLGYQARCPDDASIQRGVWGSVADATIASDSPNTNAGSSDTLLTGISTGAKRTLIRFDLGVLPPGSIISSAILHVYLRSTSNQVVRVHRVTSAWSEGTVTWNSLGNGFEEASAAYFWSKHTSVEWADITELAQAWMKGTPNYGVLLEENLIGLSNYKSSEYLTTPERPRLEVCYRPVAAQTITVQVAPSTLAAGSPATAVVTATVEDIAHTPVPSATVTGGTLPGTLGGVTFPNPTNANGKAIGTWTAGSLPGTGALFAASGGVTGTAPITLTGSLTRTIHVEVMPNTLLIGAPARSVVTATVRDGSLSPVPNVSLTGGTLPGTLGSVTFVSPTNASGVALGTWAPGTAVGTGTLYVTGQGVTGTAAISLTQLVGSVYLPLVGSCKSERDCPTHVLIQKLWYDHNGNLLSSPPANLSTSYVISAASPFGTGRCTYPAGSSTLDCTYNNDTIVDREGMHVPYSGVYTITESGLPAGWTAVSGVGTYRLADNQCIYLPAGNTCVHTIRNRSTSTP